VGRIDVTLLAPYCAHELDTRCIEEARVVEDESGVEGIGSEVSFLGSSSCANKG
jgi:hypothetical protein